MQARTRNFILIGGGVVIVGALVAFLATGMYPYTRFKSESIANANAETDLTNLLAESGADQAPPPAAVDNVNALGFLPSGPGAASLSVVTLAVPAMMAMAGAWFWERRGRRSEPRAASK